MPEKLSEKKCAPCRAGAPTLPEKEIEKYLNDLKFDWKLIENKKIRRVFEFEDFKESMKFINKVAELAETEGHHPNICLYYDKAEITLWTHKIDGLHENDFILASKIELLI